MSFAVDGVSLHDQNRPTFIGPRFPLTRPSAPKLSAHAEQLAAIETSCWLSNYGPVNLQFEEKVVQRLFHGSGLCLTVCNATIGLMIALKQAVEAARPGARYVVMPSFTFAAAAHAVLWAGLEPLLVDIDPRGWTADPVQERAVLQRHGSEIAAVMPYATFGSCLNLTHYDDLAARFGVPIVVDAAASLGSVDEDGVGFGAGSRHTFVYSMHATKAFGVGEAGLIYSADEERVQQLRRMGNFGFGADRSATMAGLNSKISEVVALSALIKLSDFDAEVNHRMALADIYRRELDRFTGQQTRGRRVAYQFMPMLLPPGLAPFRKEIGDRLRERGIGSGHYFSPHIVEQPYFQSRCRAEPLPVTDDIAARMLSLPMSDFLTTDDVAAICTVVREVCADFAVGQPDAAHPIAA